MNIKSSVAATTVGLLVGLGAGACATASADSGNIPQSCRMALKVAADTSTLFTRHLALSAQWRYVMDEASSDQRPEQQIAASLGQQLLHRTAETTTQADLLITEFQRDAAACRG